MPAVGAELWADVGGMAIWGLVQQVHLQMSIRRIYPPNRRGYLDRGRQNLLKAQMPQISLATPLKTASRRSLEPRRRVFIPFTYLPPHFHSKAQKSRIRPRFHSCAPARPSAWKLRAIRRGCFSAGNFRFSGDGPLDVVDGNVIAKDRPLVLARLLDGRAGESKATLNSRISPPSSSQLPIGKPHSGTSGGSGGLSTHGTGFFFHGCSLHRSSLRFRTPVLRNPPPQVK